LRNLPKEVRRLASPPAIDKNWISHLRTQFERARPILFTGAGFSFGAKNILDEGIPSVSTLRSRLWELCFPGTSVEDGSSLQDLYEHAHRRNRTKLSELLKGLFTVQADSLADWYRLVFEMPWQRCYTLNIDNLEEAASTKFDLPRRIAPISGTSVVYEGQVSVDGKGVLEFVHLNGALSDVPDNITFSRTQYAERLARPDPIYLRFAADLLTSPVIFVGTSLDEPPLWQHLTLRLSRGGRDHRELRHRSYLVTPTLDRARSALLAEFNVEHIPMGAEEFALRVLADLQPAAREGLIYLSSASKTEPEDSRLHEVAELATKPNAQNEFLLGNEPIWADIQANRAISRECDEALYATVTKTLREDSVHGLHIVTGTAGSGKSASLMRLCLRLSAEGVRVGWVDRYANLSPRQIRSSMRAENAPPVLAIDDVDIYGPDVANWLRDLVLSDRKPLVIAATRSGKVDRIFSPIVLKGVRKEETVMPHLADTDISSLLKLLERENRLGVLTGKPRDEQEHSFREQAGRQLLVAMIQATSGRKFEEKALKELLDLEPESQRIYSLLALASSYRFGLTRDEIISQTPP
jgi:hypothetical protein